MPVDMFLKIEGIDGESAAEGHEKWIEIHSFSWGASQTGAFGRGGGAGAGKVSMNDISFVHSYDKASPVLMTKCCAGQHIKEATLSVRKAGGDGRQDYLTYKFYDLLVTSYQTGGSGGDRPTEQLSLNFLKVDMSFFDELGQKPETAFCGGKTPKFRSETVR